jgi:transmembrane sensor
MNLDDEDKVLLEQWLEDPGFLNWAKQSDARDTSSWEHYFNRHPEHWELAKIGRSLVLGIRFQPIPTDEAQSAKDLSALLQRLERKSSPLPIQQAPHLRTLPLWKSWTKVAAVALLLFVSGLTYFQFFYHSQVIMSTGYGQQLEACMPDGSHVILNADSRLRYHSSNPRKVWLEGEAFFEVKKIVETRENFQVITEDLKVTVLGTSFNINTRNDQTKVFLQEGKVDLDVDDPQTGTIQMQPGDLIAYSKTQNKLKEQRNNVSTLENASWKEGTLVFNDTPLQKALDEIEAIYGIQFIIQSEALKGEVISGGVPIRNLQVTLQTLGEVYGIHIRPDGIRYFISGKHP